MHAAQTAQYNLNFVPMFRDLAKLQVVIANSEYELSQFLLQKERRLS
jgi:hypothetical protein